MACDFKPYADVIAAINACNLLRRTGVMVDYLDGVKQLMIVMIDLPADLPLSWQVLRGGVDNWLMTATRREYDVVPPSVIADAIDAVLPRPPADVPMLKIYPWMSRKDLA
jgi:hypothetical protein